MSGLGDLVERDRAVVWHPYTQARTSRPPLPIVGGAGAWLHTADGRRIFDGISSWWVNIHGHAHPALNAALARQAATLEHVMFAGCTHPPAVELAERLVALTPSRLTRVFYSDNGSTAVEVALKMAHQYWRNRGEPRRRTVVAFEHAYHGDTVGAMSVSEASVFTDAFTDLLFPVVRAEAPYAYRCARCVDAGRCTLACAASLESVLQAHAGQVSAVLMEPMLQGAGGMIVWPPAFLREVRRLCDAYGVLLIADEVLTGFGRTGRMFACEHAAVEPDLMCLSKGLTAGYLPMGATLASEAIYEAFLSEDRSRTFFHGHSYTANPLACAVALASLDLFRDEPVLGRVNAISRRLAAGLEALRDLPSVGEVRHIGGVGIVELVADRATRSAGGYLDAVGPALSAAFLDRGLLLRPLGNILYVMPPYVATEADVDWVMREVRDVLSDIQALRA
ncbi:MAG: adenosylmethionine--8-amino-7-oxononanoate transaminase [Vicinamibacterales bacterium]|nr:adenosylmethionine--8-amino-7-oxononanoate transaminase [Vicinamibacterales bacterium]